MDNNDVRQSRIPKKLLIIVVSAITLVIIVLATVFLLKALVPKTQSPGTSATAASIVSSYPAAVSVFAPKYQRQTAPPTVYVYYQASGHTYSVGIAATHRAVFYAKSQTQPDDSKTIQAQTTAYLRDKGFRQITDTAYTTSAVTYTSFTNNQTICQLSDTATKGVSNVYASHSFACVDQVSITQEYASVEQLISLYKKGNTAPQFTRADRTLITQGNKSLSILTLVGAQSQPRILFAAIDNQWEYIATLSTGSSAGSNGKYVPSASLTAALNNPKYGDFLKTNVN
jgi:hypothetical protein